MDKQDANEYHTQYYSVENVSDYYVKDSSLSGIKSYGKRTESQRSKASSPVQGLTMFNLCMC